MVNQKALELEIRMKELGTCLLEQGFLDEFFEYSADDYENIPNGRGYFFRLIQIIERGEACKLIMREGLK